MNTTNLKIKAATVALAGAAAIAGLGALGTGQAAASPVPHDDNFTLVVFNPVVPMLPAIGSVPASIHNGVLTIAGQSGTLHASAPGDNDFGPTATIAGVPVSLLGDGSDGYGLVANGSAWGRLVPR
ncbi:hypothetical protein [Gordonia otitidis]|uniref:hypothetical protein n=1 Tax=Gordonia otitidis TaxID=249058 RepID=UPI0023541626|nr:hypothetical protein [Gordonia otitidis]